MWAFYVPTMLAVLVATAAVQRKYAAPTVPWSARAIVGVAWVTSASIVALVPIDVWAALTGAGGRTTAAVSSLWTAAYWTTQALTWGVIPIAAGMSDAGDFTFWGRFKTSMRDSAFYYGSLAVAALAGLALLLASGRLAWRGLPGLVMVLVNAYGLVAVVLLLGHGLVAIPRSLWRASFPARRLRAHYWRVAHAADDLASAAAEARAVAVVVEATVQPLPRRDPLRPLADDVRAHAEASASPFKPSAAPCDAAGRVRLDSLTDADLDYGCDGAAGLAALKRRVTRAAGAYAGARAAYGLALSDALGAEAQVAAGSGVGALSDGLTLLGGSEPGLASSPPPSSSQAALAAAARPWALRAAAAAAAGLGFLIIWSEATLATGTHPDLSPFSHAIHAAIARNGTGTAGSAPRSSSELAAQALVGAPLAYAAAAAYRSLFALGVFPFYRVVPGATGPRSLLANAGAVTRFAAPLAYNYLHVIRMVDDGKGGGGGDTHPPPVTVFARKMAPAMRDVPLLGASFNTWFPAVVVLYALALTLDVAGSVARAVLPPRYAGFADSGGGEEGSGEGGGGGGASAEAVERGRALVREEAAAASRGEALGSAFAATIAGGLPPEAGGGGGGGGAPAASPARSETELGRGAGGAAAAGGWRGRLPGGGPPAPAPPPPALSAGTARRLAGVSPLTRALLRDKFPGGGGGGGSSLLDGGGGAAASPPAAPPVGGAATAAPPPPGSSGLDAVFGRLDAPRVDDEDWR